MSRIGFNRKKAKLRELVGIRFRLILLALLLITPLMIERFRSLEDIRAKQIARTSSEFAQLARHSIDAQREVFSSVEAVLKSSAFIHASANGSQSCAIMRASLRSDLPWIRALSVVGQDGRVQCSTFPGLLGTDLSNRDYVKDALRTQSFVISDYLFTKATAKPTVMAAYPVPIINGGEDAVIVATVDLGWMSRIMTSLSGQPGLSAFLLDSAGTVLATPPDQISLVGHPLGIPEILAAIKNHAIYSSEHPGTMSFVDVDGSKRDVTFAAIPGTGAQLVVSIDVARVSADMLAEIHTAYIQLGFLCLAILLGILVVGERLIIRPIRMMEDAAKKFAQGDWMARVPRTGLPAEFIPLARAFNGMAAQLGQRERDMMASNDRLTVMASIDLLSGLANRRGFQTRLDAEWQAAQRDGHDIALLMIDVDHFKLFNDTYGHLEGDACLTRVGTTLGAIAAGAAGFAGRYGGEEFCLLLPQAGPAQAAEIGEMVRAAVSNLAMLHATSAFRHVTVSVGVASARPDQIAQPNDLIEAADAALYAAKRRGRNTVVEHGLTRTLEPPVSMVS